MTHTDPTAANLLRGVLLRPDDDHARLVYADRLDDLGQHERAEFIRVQCWIAQQTNPHDVCPGCGYEPADGYHHNRPDCPYVRADELLTDARRREWFGIPCPVCEGATVAEHTADGWSSLEECSHCTGTGLTPFTVRRGFVESVRCRMGDVLREQYVGHAAGLAIMPGDVFNARESALTTWAAGVLAVHPVTRWEITDREPLEVYPGVWCWTRGFVDAAPHAIPDLILTEMRYAPGDLRVDYDSPELARESLALAVGREGRRLAGLPEVTP